MMVNTRKMNARLLVALILIPASLAGADDLVLRNNGSFFVRANNEWGPSVVPRSFGDGRDAGLVMTTAVPADAPRPGREESFDRDGFGLSTYEPPLEIPELLQTPAEPVETVDGLNARLQSWSRGPVRIASYVEQQISRLVDWESSPDCSSNCSADCNCQGNNCNCNDCQNSGCAGCDSGNCSGNGCGCNCGGNGSCWDNGDGAGNNGDCSSNGGCSGNCSDNGCSGGGGCGCDRNDHIIGGWLAWGSYWNSHGIRSSVGNAPLGFNNLASPQLHQAWLFFAKEAQTGTDTGFDWGYRADGMFGTDGPDTQAFGDQSWDDSWDTGGEYGFAIPQLYGEVAYNRTRVKIGHFFTIIGYEVVQAPDNFFYSRPYTMYYNEPFTHTGVLAETGWTDTITTYAGWTAGWDTGFSNGNNGSVYLGGVNWTPSDKISTTYATTIGDPGDDPVLGSDTWMSSLVMDWTPNDKWEYVFQSDFQQRQSPVLGGRSYGINQYLFRAINDCTRIGMRYEWFREGRGANGLAGASDHFHALTFGLNRITRTGIVLRPEMRYDWVDRDDAFAGGAFANGTKRSQFTCGMSAVKTF